MRVLRHAAFRAGDLHTGFLDEHPCTEPITGDRRVAAAAVALADQAGRRASANVWRGIPSGWRNNPAADQAVTLLSGDEAMLVSYRLGREAFVAVDGDRLDVTIIGTEAEGVELEIDGVRQRLAVTRMARCAMSTPRAGTSPSPSCPAIPSLTPRVLPARSSRRCRGQ